MIDWFFQWFDKLAQSAVMHYVAEHFQWVDWFAALFFILGVIYGIQNGLLSEVAEIAQIMAVIYLTIEFDGKIEYLIRTHLQFVPQDSVKATAYIVTGGSLWAAAGLLFQFLRRFFHAQLSAPLKNFGGGLLGGFHLLIIFSFLCQAVILLPYRPVKKAFEAGESYSGVTIAALAPRIHGMIAQPDKIAPV